MSGKIENPCLQFNCGAYCNPVKMKKGFKKQARDDFNSLPFLERKEILIPKAADIELETYNCKLFDKNSGKCKDYKNRPEICKSTFCKAFKAGDESEQKKIVNEIKQEKYFICGKK